MTKTVFRGVRPDNTQTGLLSYRLKFWIYSNDPEFSDRQVRANSIDPDLLL